MITQLPALENSGGDEDETFGRDRRRLLMDEAEVLGSDARLSGGSLGGPVHNPSQKLYGFQVKPHYQEALKSFAFKQQVPMIDEYDFRSDGSTPNLDISVGK